MSRRFSAVDRSTILKQMATTELDLLVIGGGITGAGIVLDAALRGMRVGLVEQNDFGSGTSSRSTKLIHGGLRYLKQGDVGLVREVGRERAILAQNAPHLVIPAPMLLPIYKKGTYSFLAAALGLSLYDWLAGVKRNERRIMLNRARTIRLEPLLRREGLVGSGYYYEYRTDDARLTLDILKTAWEHGAFAVNYAQMTQFIYRNKRAVGLRVLDRVTKKEIHLYAKQLVNAAGPWVDTVRQQDGSLQGKRLFLTKGVHLVTSREKLPVKQSAYFDTPDGRMVFVIPRGEITYFGTTDTPFSLSMEHVRTTEEDRDYLLAAINAMFPGVSLHKGDVTSHWAGVRPLIYEEGKGPSELSRKDEIIHSPSGLISIAGGKLTGYRKMAEKVVNLVAQRLAIETGCSYPGCSTDRVMISGGERFGHTVYARCQIELVEKGLARGVPEKSAQEWVNHYGSNVLSIYNRLGAVRKKGDTLREEQLLRAQLMYAIEEEMTVMAVDFLRLRTGWSFFQLDRINAYADLVLQGMSQQLKWNGQEMERQRQAVRQLLLSLGHFPANDAALFEM